MTLGGVIYFHSIAEKRMYCITPKNLSRLCQLCGDSPFARIVHGTTHWGEVDEILGRTREEQLAVTFWNTMTASGSNLKSLRFDKSEKSARAFLDAILGQLKFGENEEILNDSVPRIQNELVDLERRIPETEAGKKLRYTLDQLREIQKDEANSEKAAALAASITKQIAELRISLPRKIYLTFFVSRLEILHILSNFAFGRGKILRRIHTLESIF